MKRPALFRSGGRRLRLIEERAVGSLRSDVLLLRKFLRRHGPLLIVLILAAVTGWVGANSVSDYTNGGWELHFQRRFGQTILINIHIHHWYYGLPLYLVALLLVRAQPLASVFAFAFGQSLAAHSFVNEGGIPSIVEGGPTWRIPPEVYFPVVTSLCLLYGFFLVRREEWLGRERERERIVASYIGPLGSERDILGRIDEWGRTHFPRKRIHYDGDARIWYAEWIAPSDMEGEWQLHVTSTPFGDSDALWVVSLEHTPLRGRLGHIHERMRGLHEALALPPAIA